MKKEVFGNIAIHKVGALDSIRTLDEKETKGGLSLHKQETRNSRIQKHNRLAVMEETSWRQKSHALYLREVSRNTRFF